MPRSVRIAVPLLCYGIGMFVGIAWVRWLAGQMDFESQRHTLLEMYAEAIKLGREAKGFASVIFAAFMPIAMLFLPGFLLHMMTFVYVLNPNLYPESRDARLAVRKPKEKGKLESSVVSSTRAGATWRH